MVFITSSGKLNSINIKMGPSEQGFQEIEALFFSAQMYQGYERIAIPNFIHKL
jgi:hypothetical protein